MDIAILEDRPLRIMDSIKEMEKIGIHTAYLIYYTKDSSQNEYGLETEKRCTECNIMLIQVNSQNFTEKLDDLYENNPQIVFLFDAILDSNDEKKRFEEWKDVVYAKKKKEQCSDKERIWFYTTGPAWINEQISEHFPGRNIPVKDYKRLKQQVIFDYDFVKTHMLEQ